MAHLLYRTYRFWVMLPVTTSWDKVINWRDANPSKEYTALARRHESCQKVLFFGQTVCIKACFDTSCMAKHIFIGQSVVLHLWEGPLLRTHYWYMLQMYLKFELPFIWHVDFNLSALTFAIFARTALFATRSILEWKTCFVCTSWMGWTCLRNHHWEREMEM